MVLVLKTFDYLTLDFTFDTLPWLDFLEHNVFLK